MSSVTGRRPPQFLKGLGLGSVQTLVRLVLSFASIKVTAVYLGPSGLALVAQLLNMINLCQGILTNGAMTAILRLGAEYRDQPEQRRQFFSTALRLALGLTAICALGLLASMPWTMPWILAGQSHPFAYALASIAILAGAASIIINSAFNSAGEMTRITIIQIIGAVAGFCVFVPSAYFFHIEGALIATAFTSVIACVVALSMIGRDSSIQWRDFSAEGSKDALRRILAFYPMLLVHAGAGSLAILLVRDLAVRHVGLDAAGIWQATWRLSDQYLAILTTSVSLFFMPRLGGMVNDRGALRREILGTLWRVGGITLLAAVSLYLLREWVVRFVFAPAFRPMTELMPWQLVGDVLKMSAWILAMAMTTLLRTRWYIACELVVPAVLLGVSAALIDVHGAHALTWGYAASGVVHLLMGAFALRDVLLVQGPMSPTVSNPRQP